jgi:hypothetical protein
MQLSCPKCGTRDVRVSHRASFAEQFRSLFGIYPLRCRRCRTRWETSVWESGDWKFARCPRCYRQELTTWSEQYYRPSRRIIFMLRMGAAPYRCAACRYNFASFRKCKEKFSWRHQDRPAGPEGSVPEQPVTQEPMPVPIDSSAEEVKRL